jgi:transposase InsO family protein
MRFEFIQEYQNDYPVRLLCKAMKVSPSGYYAWRNRPPSKRELANQRIVDEIKVIHRENHENYGSPRVHKELVARGIAVGENKVARLMRRHKIRSKRKKKRKTTTNSKHDYPVAPNLLKRDFRADAPNQKWMGDITYIRTVEGWLYLAAVMDLYSRKIIGWAMEDNLGSTLVQSAFKMAVKNRHPGAGLLHHSDRGRQYADDFYRRLLRDHRVQISMSRRGDCFDNAPIESFFSTLKCELIHHRNYTNRVEARTDIFAYIEGFYNRKRRHSSLGYLSPEEFERRHSKLS